MLKKSKIKENFPIYLIVPGFMGNYQEGFVSRIYKSLNDKGCKIAKTEFKGHQEKEDILSTPDEMINVLIENFKKVRTKYPENEIIILAHSQGCAITLKSSDFFDKNTSLILMAPAIFLNEIIPPKINNDDIEKIRSGKDTKTKVSEKKFKVLTKAWLESYENFSINQKSLQSLKNPCKIIRPTDDYIDSKNIKFLIENIPNHNYYEIDTNHWFDKKSSSIEDLFKLIFMC